MNIVTLDPSRFAIAAATLAAAFNSDPLLGYFLPTEPDAKHLALQQTSQALLNYAQPYQHLYTTAERPQGVAIWLPPMASPFNGSELGSLLTSGLLSLPFYMRWTRRLSFVGLTLKTLQLHRHLAPEPHWYLAMLGVSPDCQGQGVGGQLIQPVLQMADRTQTPCYLETSTPGGVRFYQRHGFTVAYAGTWADREYWAMQRPAQAHAQP